MPLAKFYTFGCRANQYQTEQLKAQFSGEENICVINTCSVTHDAERSSKRAIRRALRQNPKPKVYAAGCWARLNAKQITELFPEVTILPNNPSTYRPIGPVKIRENLMIQDGCENFCSYCIVPYARGEVKSKPLPKVIKEAKGLVSAGAREIILTGINLGTYGKNVAQTFRSAAGLKTCTTLTCLLQALSKIKNLLRIRLSSIEPMYLTTELIETVAKTPQVCNYLHVPLQSGDNTILKAMNRNYTREEFKDLIGKVRSAMPDCGLSTDVIVGFPGETQMQFANTVQLIKELNFSRLHIFSYSKRAGTSAAQMPNQIDGKIKKERNSLLQKLHRKQMVAFAEKHLHKQLEILVEQKGQGLTSNFIRCFFGDPKNYSGQIKCLTAEKVTKTGEIRGGLSPLKYPCSL